MLIALSACNPLTLAPPPPADGPILMLEVDAEALRTETLEGIAERMAETLRTNSIAYSGRGVSGDAARIAPASAADVPRAREALAPLSNTPDGTPTLTVSEADGYIEARLTEAHLDSLLRQAAEASAQIISRRLSPDHPEIIPIELKGGGRFTVRAPSAIEPDLVSRIATTPGRLTFHLVNDSAEYVDRIPPGHFAAQPHAISHGDVEVVRDRPSLTGDNIERATPSVDSMTGEWVLSFQLDPPGAQIFCRLTREHAGERFAILLDQRVLTAPMINEQICGGSAQISGNFTAQSAQELATLLNAGGLPAPVRLLEVRTGE